MLKHKGKILTIILGLLMIFAYQTCQNLSDLGDFIKDFLFPVCGLYLATYGLSTWRTQHIEVEKYRLILGLLNQTATCKESLETMRHRSTSTNAFHQLNIEEHKEYSDDLPKRIRIFKEECWELSKLLNRSKFIFGSKIYENINRHSQNLMPITAALIRRAKRVLASHGTENLGDSEPACLTALNELDQYLQSIMKDLMPEIKKH